MTFYACCPICRKPVKVDADHRLEGTDRKGLDEQIQERAAAHSATCAKKHAEKSA